MVRTRNDSEETMIEYADGILTADWHVRSSIPVCRTDDFMTAMWKKIKFIFDLSLEHQCPIYIAGDMGDKSTWSNSLLVWFLRKMQANKFYSIVLIPGQHDLPNHNLQNIDKSGMAVLCLASEKVEVITEPGLGSGSNPNPDIFVYGFPFGTEIFEKNGDPEIFKVAMTHQLVIEDKPEWKDQVATSAKSLLKKFPGYNLILSGDNHKPFVVNFRGRLLVNPGSLMRTRADQIDHKPRVYLWYAGKNEVKPVYLPIEKDVIDRSHIDDKEERDGRVEAYVRHLKKNEDITFSFDDNMTAELKNNRIKAGVRDKIREAMSNE